MSLSSQARKGQTNPQFHFKPCKEHDLPNLTDKARATMGRFPCPPWAQIGCNHQHTATQEKDQTNLEVPLKPSRGLHLLNLNDKVTSWQQTCSHQARKGCKTIKPLEKDQAWESTGPFNSSQQQDQHNLLAKPRVGSSTAHQAPVGYNLQAKTIEKGPSIITNLKLEVCLLNKLMNFMIYKQRTVKDQAH